MSKQTKLAKSTQDGIIILPKMTVWYWDSFYRGSSTYRVIKEICSIQIDPCNDFCKIVSKNCYSTKKAAIKNRNIEIKRLMNESL